MGIEPGRTDRPAEQEMRAEELGTYEELLPAARLSNAAISDDTVKSIGIVRRGAASANSSTVRSRLCRATCGWKKPATEAEFDQALRAEQPDSRQTNILDVWATEATPEEVFRAWAEGVYTPRVLAAALHRAGLHVSKTARFLNNFDQEPG